MNSNRKGKGALIINVIVDIIRGY